MIHADNLSLVETERLILREPESSDLEAAFNIHGDPRTNKFNPNGPASREETEIMLAAWRGHWQKYHFGYWVVCAADNSKNVIGFGGILRKQIADQLRLNLYFRPSPLAWGHGYAIELAGAALSAENG